MELKETGVKDSVAANVEKVRSKVIKGVNVGEDYDHHYRRKSRLVKELFLERNYFQLFLPRKELLKISAAVMGIEFAYAAETAFVSPTLLKIGQLILVQ